MKLHEVLEHLHSPDLCPDDWVTPSCLDLDVVFNTTSTHNLELFSVYLVDGVINVDIGEVSER